MSTINVSPASKTTIQTKQGIFHQLPNASHKIPGLYCVEHETTQRSVLF